MSGFNPGASGVGQTIQNPRQGTVDPFHDLFSYATNKNQFGELSWADFSKPLDGGVAKEYEDSPMALLGSAFTQNNMRSNPQYGKFSNRVMGGMGAGVADLYHQLRGGTDPEGLGIGDWANRLVSGYRGSGASEWLGNSGAKDVLSNMFAGNLQTGTQDIVNTPGRENDLVNLLQAVAFQGLSNAGFNSFKQQLQDASFAWSQIAPTQDITLWQYIKESGLLQHFGLA
jgi:hypothetical protein